MRHEVVFFSFFGNVSPGLSSLEHWYLFGRARVSCRTCFMHRRPVAITPHLLAAEMPTSQVHPPFQSFPSPFGPSFISIQYLYRAAIRDGSGTVCRILSPKQTVGKYLGYT